MFWPEAHLMSFVLFCHMWSFSVA